MKPGDIVDGPGKIDMSQSFAKYVVSTYGRSIYQIELEVAIDHFVNRGTFHDQADGVKALRSARYFLRAMHSAWKGTAFTEPLTELEKN